MANWQAVDGLEALERFLVVYHTLSNVEKLKIRKEMGIFLENHQTKAMRLWEKTERQVAGLVMSSRSTRRRRARR